MKIYIITEGATDKIIRGVTLSENLASKICEMFSYLTVRYEEFETLEDEQLKQALEIKKCR